MPRRSKAAKARRGWRACPFSDVFRPWLQSPGGFGYTNGHYMKVLAAHCRSIPNGCGCSSGVEHDLAKVGVEGSNPFARSSWFKRLDGIERLVEAFSMQGISDHVAHILQTGTNTAARRGATSNLPAMARSGGRRRTGGNTSKAAPFTPLRARRLGHRSAHSNTSAECLLGGYR